VIELQPVANRNNRTGAIFFMNERLLTESNSGWKISLSGAAGNADFASTTGLPMIHDPESGDGSATAAIPAAGESRSHKISSPFPSPTNAVPAYGVGTYLVRIIARCSEDRLFSCVEAG
jgi:hypothetical protein